MGDVMMQQTMNKLTGQLEWMVVAHDDDHDGEGNVGEFGSSGEVASEALTMTTYLDMLNDTARNRAYHLAIEKAVKGAHHVLDIGAGTGLLSMMAWRAMCDVSTLSTQGASNKVVGPFGSTMGCSITACESYLPMFKLARKLLRANRVGAGVRLIHKRSDELEVGIDMPCRADVLISEILDSELLGEGLVPTLRHAHQNLLTPDARCVPHKATIYAQVVECEYLWRCHDLPGVESQLADGLVLAPCDFNQMQGRSAALHVDPLSSQTQLLSEPFKVVTFELSTAPEKWGQHQHTVPIIRGGRAHALVSWWVLQLDREGEVLYSTAPKWIQTEQSNDENGPSEWTDHWKQVVWFLPGKGIAVSAGELVSVTASHDSISVSYSVVSSHSSDASGKPRYIVPREQHSLETSGTWNAMMSPERIGVLGLRTWRSAIKIAAEIAFGCQVTSLCAVLDDSLLMTLVSASLDSSVRVVAMFPGRCVGQDDVDHISILNSRDMSNIRIMSKKASSLTSQDVEGRQVDVLMAEPYYASCHRMLPWRMLRFWYERTQLTSILSENVTVVPCKGLLRGVAVNMPDLWKSRRCLENVEGFNHHLVNTTLGACGQLPPPHEGPLLPYAIWQCGHYEELTDIFTLVEFDLSSPIEMTQGSIEAEVQKDGLCHGIVLWIDWILDPAGRLVLSTGPEGGQPSYWKQGVKLLSSPVQVEACPSQLESEPAPCSPLPGNTYSFVKAACCFNSSDGELHVNVSFA